MCRNSAQVKKRGGTVNYEEKKSQDDEFLQRSSCKNEKKGEVKEIEVWMNDYARKMFDGRTSDEMYELFREEEKEWNMA